MSHIIKIQITDWFASIELLSDSQNKVKILNHIHQHCSRSNVGSGKTEGQGGLKLFLLKKRQNWVVFHRLENNKY